MSFAAFKIRFSDRISDKTDPERVSARLPKLGTSFADRCCTKMRRKTDSMSHHSWQSFDSLDCEGLEDVMTEFVPENERLRALQEIQPAFQGEGEEPFNSIVKLVRSIFHVPIVLVSLVYDDFQWFKAGVGLDVNQTPRCQSFCAHTFIPLQPEVLYIENALNDERFCNNPLVLGPPHIRFYCGVPLITQDHIRLGTLCMIEDQPRSIDKKGMQMLINVAELTIRELLKSEVGKNAYQQKFFDKHVAVRKLPSLARAQAMRDAWFAHVLDIGLIIVDASTSNWNVLWTSPTWSAISDTFPMQQQSLWRLIRPVKEQSAEDIHKRVFKAFSSGKSHASLIAQLLQDRYSEANCLSCRVCPIENFKSLLPPLIRVPAISDSQTDSPEKLHVTESALLVVQVSLTDSPKADEETKENEETKDSKIKEGDAEGLDPSLVPIIKQIRRLDADGSGEIEKEVLFDLMDRLKKGSGKEQGQEVLDWSGVERNGRVPYVKFFKWLHANASPCK